MFVQFKRFSSNYKSALANRLEHILDEKVARSSRSILESDPDLRKIYEKYETLHAKDSEFDHAKAREDAASRQYKQHFQKEIAYVKSENLLRSKDERQIGEFWSGEEKIHDTTLRMLVDSASKPKRIRKSAATITPARSRKSRIIDAKEGSLDYKISKTLSPEEKEKEKFRELYKERLLGPSMFLDHTSSSTAAGLIGNMASARINAVINRKTGKFDTPDMETVRGKPLDKERLSNSTDSNFFMNQILKNQECLPVWIENQQGIDKDIAAFRLNLQQKLFQYIQPYVTSSEGSMKHLHSVLASIDAKSLHHTVSRKLMTEDRSYLETKIESLNQGVRNYNLQCPSAAIHKWKLTLENEIKMSFDAVMLNFENLQNENLLSQPPSKSSQIKSDGAKRWSLFGAKSSRHANGEERSIFKFWLRV